MVGEVKHCDWLQNKRHSILYRGTEWAGFRTKTGYNVYSRGLPPDGQNCQNVPIKQGFSVVTPLPFTPVS